MILAHQIRLQPNDKQATMLSKSCGVARYAYNWALNRWINAYQQGEKITERDLRKELNAVKRDQFPWMLEVTKYAPQQAIMDLGVAFTNYFRKREQNGYVPYSEKQKQRALENDRNLTLYESNGHPKYHKKGVNDSFYIGNDQFYVKGKQIHIPRIGKVRMREAIRFTGKLVAATVKRVADKWYVSIQIEWPQAETKARGENQARVTGVDLGINNLATLVDGSKTPGQKPHKALLNRQRRLNKELARRRQEGKTQSKNYYKTKNKLARLHARIANIRKDETHKLTTSLVSNYDAIGIESLNISGMVKNHRLARSILDMSFFEFRRQLEYKAGNQGVVVVVADPFYPSSKICSSCGFKLEQLDLSVRQWVCPSCNVQHDRDVNAAINLRNIALSVLQ